jgi:hypothetical protein
MGEKLGYPAFPSVRFVCFHYSRCIRAIHQRRSVTRGSFHGQFDHVAQWPSSLLERCKNRFVVIIISFCSIRLTGIFYQGTAGYGNTTFTIGQSYADQPVLAPIIYNPNAPAGQKWTRDGLSPSTVPRMYHSTATLMPDGKFQLTSHALLDSRPLLCRLCLRLWI